jgi:branched-chain amino acid transport system substrate-binding protein
MKMLQITVVGILASIFSLVSLGSCTKAPHSIGFIGPMTGPSANIGVEGYRGFTMAVEEANAAGGVHGRLLVVSMLDDQGNPDACLESARDLVDRGVSAVVLHTTSGAAAGALPWLQEQDVLVVSRTVTDPAWVGLDDNFIRFIGTADLLAWPLATFALERGHASVGMVLDKRNEAYAVSMASGFAAKAGQTRISDPLYVDTGWSPDSVARWALESGFDSILAVLSGLDAALLAQALERVGYSGDLLLAPWSQDHNLLSYAGRMADRIFISSTFNPDDPSLEYQAFKDRYHELYGQDPVMSGVFGYDVASFLLDGIARKRKSDSRTLKAALLEIGHFDGLQYGSTLDTSGDAATQTMIITIHNGVFVPVGR